jgi:cytochrome P450
MSVAAALMSVARRPRLDPRLPPGPDLPPAAQIALWIFRPYDFLEHCREKYGPTFTLRLGKWPHAVAFTQPEDIREIFTGPSEVFYAGPANDVLRPVVGDGSLLLLDGERHLRERKLLLPPFHGERMNRYGAVMRAITERAMERLPLGRPFEIHPAMQAITLDVILRTVFGVDEGAELEELRAAIVELTNGFNAFNLVPALRVDLGPRSPYGRFLARRDRIDALLYARIRARRAEGPSERDDIMTLLLGARHEDGSPMSDQDLRDELMTLLAAGHETSATVLPWVFHYLTKHPGAQSRARAEIDAGGEQPYLDAIIKETMRLRPVIAAVARVLQRDHTVAGWRLPAKTLVSPSIYLAHRERGAWPHPERFDPERFLDKKISPYAYLPFGGGIRRCIGMAFALYEMRVVLATILGRYRARAVSREEPRPVRRGVTLMPSGGMPVLLERR